MGVGFQKLQVCRTPVSYASTPVRAWTPSPSRFRFSLLHGAFESELLQCSARMPRTQRANGASSQFAHRISRSRAVRRSTCITNALQPAETMLSRLIERNASFREDCDTNLCFKPILCRILHLVWHFPIDNASNMKNVTCDGAPHVTFFKKLGIKFEKPGHRRCAASIRHFKAGERSRPAPRSDPPTRSRGRGARPRWRAGRRAPLRPRAHRCRSGCRRGLPAPCW